MEEKISQIIADKFNLIASKVTNKKDFQIKKIFLQGCQPIDFTREEQINFTHKYYTTELIN